MCTDNKLLIRRFFGVMNAKEQVTALAELIAPDCSLNGHVVGIQGIQQLATMMRTAFPDEQMTIEALIVEGDTVAARLSSSATHQGTWLSPPGAIVPAGKRVNQTGMQFFRIANSMIVEIWATWDLLGLLQQLTVLSSTPHDGG